MPIYELYCNGCRKDFETISKVGEKHIPCIHCGSSDTRRYISISSYRHADHWMKDMMGAMHRSQERDKLKKEISSQAS